MYQRVTEHQFINEMAQSKHGFSYEGAQALCWYLHELEESMGEEIEFDPVSFRGEFSEYEGVDEAKKDYLVDPNDMSDEDFMDEFVVYYFEGGVIVHNH